MLDRVVIEPTQHPIAAFSDQKAAETALQALQQAGFLPERVALVPQTPPVPATAAKRSGSRGAIAGAVGGALAGLMLSLIKTNIVGGMPNVLPINNMIGMALVGSLIGAVGMGLIAAMMGVNVRSDGNQAEASGLRQDFVLFAKDLQPDELAQARAIAQQHGGDHFEKR